jgi:hypothetical protein
MSYQTDLENITKYKDDATNFGAQVLRLVMKADLSNLRLLQRAFPNAVQTVKDWRESGVIPDYPYDTWDHRTPGQKQRDETLVYGMFDTAIEMDEEALKNRIRSHWPGGYGLFD